jgi:farnesyl-diphosphate farnesyltransferase
MCRRHLFPDAKLDETQLLGDAVRFGKGLQLVNILRDLPRDLRQGRCYLPAQRLAQAGLRPEDLLQAENLARFRPVYDRLLGEAEAHLAAGWRYTNTLPHSQWRLRFACALPILIGVRTLQLLRTANILGTPAPLKVSRAGVRAILVRALVRVPFPGALPALWHPPASTVGKAVASSGDLT